MNEEANFCSQCGSKINSDAKFCSSCGHDLKNSSTKITSDKTIKVELTNATGKGLEKGYGFIFNGLTEALKENLSLQKKGGDFIVTEVKIDNGECIQVVQASGVADIPNPSFPGLAIVLPVVDGKINGSCSLSKFEQMEESKLFTKYEYPDYTSFGIDYGSDHKGAAYLTSKLLIHVFGAGEGSAIVTTTEEFG